MVPISPAWRDYYTELEPERRAEMLQRNLREEAEDGANAYRKRLFSLRYIEEGKREPSVDRWLWACVNFIQVYSSSRFSGGAERKRYASF